eukprot:2002211-Alexandrium_andersonii.AAC.1
MGKDNHLCSNCLGAANSTATSAGIHRGSPPRKKNISAPFVSHEGLRGPQGKEVQNGLQERDRLLLADAHRVELVQLRNVLALHEP